MTKLETGFSTVDVSEQCVQASIALSLKRIADVICAPPMLVANLEGVDAAALKDVLSKSQAGVIVEGVPEPNIVRRTHISLGLTEVEDAPLGEVPPGLYLYGRRRSRPQRTLIMKTQYSSSSGGPEGTHPYAPDCYIVDGGEYFVGGVSKHQIRDLRVKPVAFKLP